MIPGQEERRDHLLLAGAERIDGEGLAAGEGLDANIQRVVGLSAELGELGVRELLEELLEDSSGLLDGRCTDVLEEAGLREEESKDLWLCRSPAVGSLRGG
ncbi:hypothetical protein [Nannocystis pusilla]|uniref:Uncharacterized protein n=1 Tax=Nannocystis pusilla TaxID=889268 RepID=A0ABS7TZI5_9BACT|nr:hypothetical protein [Nannocystis pusilla]MBZ5713604.1 hypothetical protein [Nannocystis pusilla]